jgi:hypothetical protein
MQSLCNQSVTRKMSWSVGRVAGVMIKAERGGQFCAPDASGSIREASPFHRSTGIDCRIMLRHFRGKQPGTP